MSDVTMPGVWRSVEPTDHGGFTAAVVHFALSGSVDEAALDTLRDFVGNDLRAGRRRFLVDLTRAGHLDGRALERLTLMSYAIMRVGGALSFLVAHDATVLALRGARLSNCFPVILTSEPVT